jgi:hypothetical protein
VKVELAVAQFINSGCKGGYRMKYSKRIIMMLFTITALTALSGCGGGADQGQNTDDMATATPSTATNTYLLTEDNYGVQNATFMSATNRNGLFVMRAAIADSMTDPDFSTVFRIDIVQPAQIGGPGSYAVGAAGSPVEILFFNGHRSTLLNTASGIVTFTSYGVCSGDVVAGSFQVTVEDQNSGTVPRPTYSIKGSFRFIVNTYGALVPTLSPVPAGAAGNYNTKCASCHALGSLDPGSAGSAPDLALKGGDLPAHFAAGVPGHKEITLTAEELQNLKILLNAS